MNNENWWPRHYRFDGELAPGVARAWSGRRAVIVKRGGVAPALAGLRHPHLAVVSATGATHHVMLPVAGEPLARRLEGAPVPAATALRWTGQLLDALACLHQAGLVHRDVSAANVLVDDATLVLIDFGLAGPPGPCAVAGTPASTAPEQWRGHADARSDLFGVGVLLYRLLTHQHPFPGSAFDALHRILHGPVVAPSQRCPGLGTAFDALLARALAPLPARRFCSAHDMASALARL